LHKNTGRAGHCAQATAFAQVGIDDYVASAVTAHGVLRLEIAAANRGWESCNGTTTGLFVTQYPFLRQLPQTSLLLSINHCGSIAWRNQGGVLRILPRPIRAKRAKCPKDGQAHSKRARPRLTSGRIRPRGSGCAGTGRETRIKPSAAPDRLEPRRGKWGE